jgi:8-oxo-dGTP pyrophosphatase MutT (NUDIX family)
MSIDWPIGRWVAAALLVTADGRYLMQLRDDIPTIMLPAHWSLFGGSIDEGESAAAAMRRELLEELEFPARDVALFTEMIVELPREPRRYDRMSFFAVPVTTGDIAGMQLREGADLRLFTPEALALEPRVAPWDLAAVMMHARQHQLFPRAQKR